MAIMPCALCAMRVEFYLAHAEGWLCTLIFLHTRDVAVAAF